MRKCSVLWFFYGHLSHKSLLKKILHIHTSHHSSYMGTKELKKQSKRTKRKLQRQTERRQRRTECEVKCHTGWSVRVEKWIHYSHSRQQAARRTISVTHQSEKPLHGSRVGMEQSDLLSVQMACQLIS